MKSDWYIIDINPRGVFASRINSREAAFLLDRQFQVLLADGNTLNALALRHRLPLRVRELGGAVEFSQLADVA